MDKSAAIEIINRFRKGIEVRGIKPVKVILYGSFAAGTNREGSDIDVVVVSDDFEGMGYWERIDIISDAVYEIFAPVEAVAMTSEEWERGDSIITDFARNGEILFAA
jgi:predicted nucleotidyltransferase